MKSIDDLYLVPKTRELQVENKGEVSEEEDEVEGEQEAEEEDADHEEQWFTLNYILQY